MSDSFERLKSALADRYAIEREIGAGGMATVYLAEDLKHHRKVAVKVLRPELAAALGPDRFLREIEIAAQLHHPHILPLYDSGDADGFLFYVMPYEEGKSLREKLAMEGELPVTEAVRILRDIVDALSHAHQHKVIHRDIKPDNVMLSDRHALVTDFGVAKAVSEATGREQLTTAGLALGTPAYMAPEQATADPHVDHRADIYAVGAVAYELLTGRPPFLGSNAQMVLAAHVADTPDPVTKYRESVPPALEQLVMKCLEKKPADRWQTAEELIPHLETLVTPSGGVTPTAVGQPVSSSRRVGIFSVAILTFFVVAAVGIWWATRIRSDVIPSASRIAVAPFAPAVDDTALTRLGRDLVVLLSANLDGVGDIATVDASAIVGQSALREASYTLEDAVEMGRSFGAASVVHGSLVRLGDSVRIDAALISTRDSEPLARLNAAALENEVGSLADSLTWRLLAEVWRGEGRPSPFLVSDMTSSIDALRAFLEGAQAETDARYVLAVSAYQRAIDADSTFWMAYWRYASALAWMLQPVPQEYRDAYWEHRFELPERARALMEAQRVSPRSARLEALLRVTTRYPDYVPAWYAYGDDIYHLGGFFGKPLEDAVEAFERLVELNPATVTGLEHLADAFLALGDSARTRWALEKLVENGAREKLYEFYGADLLGFMQMCQLVQFEGFDAMAFVDTTDRFVDEIKDLQPQTLGGVLASPFCGQPRLNSLVAEKLLTGRVSRSQQEAVQGSQVLSLAARGAWDSALVVLDGYREVEGGNEDPIGAYRLASLGTFFDALDSTNDVELRRGALGAATTPEDTAEVIWLSGVAAISTDDVESARAARDQLRSLGARSAVHLTRGLDALLIDVDGSRQDAIAELQSLVVSTGDSGMQFRYPSFDPVVRTQLSQWHLEAGNAVEAAEPLLWIESAFNNGPVYRVTQTVASLVYLQRARVEEARGRTERAIRFYREFLQRYDMPVERQRHLVEEAEAALARLAGVTEVGER